MKKELLRHIEVLKEFVEEENYKHAQVVHKDINDVFEYLGLELLLVEAEEVPSVETKAMVDDVFGLPGEETGGATSSQDIARTPKVTST